MASEVLATVLPVFKRLLRGSHPMFQQVSFTAAGLHATNCETEVVYPLEDAPGRKQGFRVPLAHLERFLEGTDKGSPVHFAATLTSWSNETVTAKVVVSATKRGVAMSSELLGVGEGDGSFPPISALPATVPQVFDETTQKALADCVAFTSADPTRHLMHSVAIDPKNGSLAATDGRRLQVFEGFHWRHLRDSLIVPSDLIELLGVIARKSPGIWRVRPSVTGPKRIWVSLGPWTVAARTEEGVFPNYRQVIPKLEKRRGHAVFSRTEAKRLAEVIPLMPPANFEAKDDATRLLTITLNGELAFGVGNNKVTATATTAYQPRGEGDPGYVFVGVNQRFLLDALEAGHTEIFLEDELSPVVLRGPGRLHVLMPLRLE